MAEVAELPAMGREIDLDRGRRARRACPAAGRKKPAIIRKRLDLPLPLGPRSSSASPGESANETPAKTRRPARMQAS